jgi:hypothetical protein
LVSVPCGYWVDKFGSIKAIQLAGLIHYQPLKSHWKNIFMDPAPIGFLTLKARFKSRLFLSANPVPRISEFS